jgi:DNA-binding transcriptional MocR family regulator
VQVTAGSQDPLSKAIDMLVDENSTVIVEGKPTQWYNTHFQFQFQFNSIQNLPPFDHTDPTYPGALQALRAQGCEMVGVGIDKHGMMVDQLVQVLADAKKVRNF